MKVNFVWSVIFTFCLVDVVLRGRFVSQTSKTFVQCIDFNGVPSATVGDTFFIKIGDVDDMELVYYEAEIAVGDSFTLNGSTGGMKTESLILVYSSSDNSRSNLLQSIYVSVTAM